MSPRSARSWGTCPDLASGDMNCGVPPSGANVTPTLWERPKSISFIVASCGGRGSTAGSRRVKRKCSGFRSLCTTPFWCRCETANSICANRVAMSLSGSRPLETRMRSNTSPPSQSSNTRCTEFFSSYTSRIRMTLGWSKRFRISASWQASRPGHSMPRSTYWVQTPCLSAVFTARRAPVARCVAPKTRLYLPSPKASSSTS
mmetsp:Transcript_44078/g.136585  ORF Transcript_44078/g.136585 Transcript_44078/m.136585 type:complete len:202 (+) Transcript_44078:1466-2071(+)